MGQRGRPPHPDILTPRQWEVLALIRDGHTDQQIADRLGISLDGAKYHVSEILSRLGVETREEAARWSESQSVGRGWAGGAVRWGLVASGTLGILAVVVLAAGTAVTGTSMSESLEISREEALVIAGSFTGFRWVATAEAEHVSMDEASEAVESATMQADASEEAWLVTVVTEGVKPDSLQEDWKDTDTTCGKYTILIPDTSTPVPLVIEGISHETSPNCGYTGYTTEQMLAFTGRMLGWRSGEPAPRVALAEPTTIDEAVERYGPSFPDLPEPAPGNPYAQSVWRSNSPVISLRVGSQACLLKALLRPPVKASYSLPAGWGSLTTELSPPMTALVGSISLRPTC